MKSGILWIMVMKDHWMIMINFMYAMNISYANKSPIISFIILYVVSTYSSFICKKKYGMVNGKWRIFQLLYFFFSFELLTTNSE